MKTITDITIEYYLQQIIAAYHMLVDDRELTISQKDKIKKTLTAIKQDFDYSLKK